MTLIKIVSFVVVIEWNGKSVSLTTDEHPCQFILVSTCVLLLCSLHFQQLVNLLHLYQH